MEVRIVFIKQTMVACHPGVLWKFSTVDHSV